MVFIDNNVIEVPKQRIQLVATSQELYPEDYDLDSLFTDYHTQK